jgi:hypothetical protein
MGVPNEEHPVAIKKASAVKVVKRRNGRYVVRKRGGGLINGAEKTTALEAAGVVKKLKPKAKPAAEGEAAPAQ